MPEETTSELVEGIHELYRSMKTSQLLQAVGNWRNPEWELTDSLAVSIQEYEKMAAHEATSQEDYEKLMTADSFALRKTSLLQDVLCSEQASNSQSSGEVEVDSADADGSACGSSTDPSTEALISSACGLSTDLSNETLTGEGNLETNVTASVDNISHEGQLKMTLTSGDTSGIARADSSPSTGPEEYQEPNRPSDYHSHQLEYAAILSRLKELGLTRPRADHETEVSGDADEANLNSTYILPPLPAFVARVFGILETNTAAETSDAEVESGRQSTKIGDEGKTKTPNQKLGDDAVTMQLPTDLSTEALHHGVAAELPEKRKDEIHEKRGQSVVNVNDPLVVEPDGKSNTLTNAAEHVNKIEVRTLELPSPKQTDKTASGIASEMQPASKSIKAKEINVTEAKVKEAQGESRETEIATIIPFDVPDDGKILKKPTNIPPVVTEKKSLQPDQPVKKTLLVARPDSGPRSAEHAVQLCECNKPTCLDVSRTSGRLGGHEDTQDRREIFQRQQQRQQEFVDRRRKSLMHQVHAEELWMLQKCNQPHHPHPVYEQLKSPPQMPHPYQRAYAQPRPAHWVPKNMEILDPSERTKADVGTVPCKSDAGLLPRQDRQPLLPELSAAEPVVPNLTKYWKQYQNQYLNTNIGMQNSRIAHRELQRDAHGPARNQFCRPQTPMDDRHHVHAQILDVDEVGFPLPAPRPRHRVHRSFGDSLGPGHGQLQQCRNQPPWGPQPRRGASSGPVPCYDLEVGPPREHPRKQHSRSDFRQVLLQKNRQDPFHQFPPPVNNRDFLHEDYEVSHDLGSGFLGPNQFCEIKRDFSANHRQWPQHHRRHVTMGSRSQKSQLE